MSPYLGFGSLRPALDLAAQTGRGVFVLALTSNPEGRTVQHARLRDDQRRRGDGRAAAAARTPTPRPGASSGSVGLVVGATVGDAVQELGLDLAAVNGPLLAPGVGAQGGTSDDLRRRLRRRPAQGRCPRRSREVLRAGPDVAALRERARESEAVPPRCARRSPDCSSGPSGRAAGRSTATRERRAARLVSVGRPDLAERRARACHEIERASTRTCHEGVPPWPFRR